jgi:hypothetical protein
VDFFYTSGGGAVDFAALLLVCLAALVFGNREVRVCSAVLLAAYLSKRFGLMLADRQTMAAALSVFDVLAVATILLNTASRSARFFAVLFAAEMGNYAMLATSLETWTYFVPVALSVLYLQLAMLLSGAASNGIRNRRGTGSGDRPRYRRVADLARWI